MGDRVAAAILFEWVSDPVDVPTSQIEVALNSGCLPLWLQREERGVEALIRARNLARELASHINLDSRWCNY
ncbi:hypothetical protein KY289_002742 [Solanum tuberosum]|nr:hypothetical protein KY289_002742 [Solanum tuberosum]